MSVIVNGLFDLGRVLIAAALLTTAPLLVGSPAALAGPPSAVSTGAAQAGGVVGGVLREGHQSTPIASGVVAVLDPDTGEVLGIGETGTDGSFLIYGVPAGEFLVVGFHPDYDENLAVGTVDIAGGKVNELSLFTSTAIPDPEAADASGLGLLLSVGREIHTQVSRNENRELAATIKEFVPAPKTAPPSAQPKAEYSRSTPARAKAVVDTYGSIPGGITLEGMAAGPGSWAEATWLEPGDVLGFGDGARYPIPVPQGDAIAVLRAIQADARLGVSLGSTEIVFGELAPSSAAAWYLFVADQLMGNITFGRHIPGYRYARGYEPAVLEDPASGRASVYFTLSDFAFQRRDGAISLATYEMNATLIPTGSDAKNGGRLPDFGRIEAGDFPGEWEENARHLTQEFGYYAREAAISRAIALGEFAAVCRSMKAAGNDLLRLSETAAGRP